jgi:hypothetical protein
MTVPTTTPRFRGRSITRRYLSRVPAPRRAALLTAVVLTAGASSAVAADAPTIDKSPRLWATINICDTAKHPDTIGIRASMPGSGRRTEKMYMRFQVQYFRPSTQKWAPTDATFDSGWRMVGSATYRRRESGWNFSITPPPAGQTYRLRGVVSYEWRKGKSTDAVRSATKRTRSGHPGTFGADPKRFSAAECIVKP